MGLPRINIERWITWLDSGWTVGKFIWGSGLMASFGLAAWGVWAARIFADYSPLSWVVAGFIGGLIWVMCLYISALAYKLRVVTAYNARFLDKGVLVNPLDALFERKRILLNDFVLPSHRLIGKVFVDCDLIGPANIYLHSGNRADPIREPKFDAVWLSPAAAFDNGFVFKNCIFKNCSFQRVTMFASIENYPMWKDDKRMNWISINPHDDDLSERKAILARVNTPPQPPPVPMIEDHSGS
jgi:hypothetical protein